jgi:hypothetical protein
VPTVPPDEPTPRPLTFAFPLAGGRWAIRRGTAFVRDGILLSVEVPGLGRRAGPEEGGGLTAVFYVADRVRGRRGARTGAVSRWEIERGRVVSAVGVADAAELDDGAAAREGGPPPGG